MQHIPEIEQQPLAIQLQYQAGRLKELLHYLQQYSPYYQRIFKEQNIDIASVKKLEDIQSLPRTEKKDLQLNNGDFLCIPRDKVREYTSTSGTLGEPVFIALSEKDLDRLAYNEYLSFNCMEAGNTYQLMLTLDRQFMAGMAYYSGLRKAGKTIIRTGPGLPSMQWEVIDKMQSDTLVAVPSFLLRMIEYAQANNINLSQSPVKRVLAIGESLRDEQLQSGILANKIKKAWNIDLYATYASTEMQTAFTECNAFAGGHQHPELIITEILDEQGKPVPHGESGEVTITTLGIEAMPLLRYRTGDICKAYYEPCSCGRQTMRLGPVLGRQQQMIKFKGTSLYPSAISELLYKLDFVKEYAIEVNTTEHGQDGLILHIYTESDKEVSDRALKPLLQHRLRVLPELVYHTSESINKLHFPGGGRKPIRFIDKRQIQ